MWPLVFWALLFCGGWALLQMTSATIRVAAADYAGSPWGWIRIAVLDLWGVLCLAGLLAESFGLRPPTGGWWTPRQRSLAVWPLAVVAALAGGQALWGSYSFVQIPIAAALFGWSLGRLLPEYVTRSDVESPRSWRRWWIVATAVALAFAAMWFADLQRAHDQGRLGYIDIGTFAARLQGTVNGTHPFREAADTPPFWDHFEPGLYLLCPLVWVFDVVALLNAAAALAVAVTALIWFWYARRRGWRPVTAAALAVGWLLLPAASHLPYAMSLGFHPVLLAMPLVAASLLMAAKGRWLAFAICAALACSFRETVALSYAGVGLWLLADRPSRRKGAVILAVFVAYFATVSFVMIPALRGSAGYIAAERFGQLGHSIGDILLSPFTRPGAFWSTLASEQSLVYVAVMLGCLGFVPAICGGRRWLALLPEGVFLLLWPDPLLRSIAYHYHAIVLVLVFWITVEGLTRLRDSGQTARARRWLHVCVVSALAGAVFLGWFPRWHDTTPFDPLPSRRSQMAWVGTFVSPGETIAASQRVALHCLHAGETRILPEYNAPAEDWPDVFLLDYADDWGRLALESALPALRRWQLQLIDAGYVPVGVNDSIVVYRNPPRWQDDPVMLMHEFDQIPRWRQPIEIWDGQQCLGWHLESVGRESDQTKLRATIALRCEQPIKTDLAVAMSLRFTSLPDRPIAFSPIRPAGRLILPSTNWEPGKVIVEQIEIPWVLPKLPDEYELISVIHLYDLATGKEIAATAIPNPSAK